MSINGKNIKEAFLAGASLLAAKREYINELNVFPVPDGDTGTNMSMTLQSAVNAINGAENDDIENICKAISSGSLRGARGNSGVIMSQILRGFTNYIKEKKDVDINDLFKALEKSKETAYKAVIKPKEGTILTVIKGLSDKATELSGSSISDLEKLEKIVDYGKKVLDKTPDMLPILKEAGVVDSGGMGLMTFMDGVLSYVKGEEIDLSQIEQSSTHHTNINVNIEEDADIEFDYCTEFIINNSKGFSDNTETELKEYLGEIGDSLVVVCDDDLIKIHVHTNHPGKAFEKGLEYGFLTSMKVDNLRLEHQEKVIKDSEKKAKEQKEQDSHINKKPENLKNVGFVVVSNGKGLDDIFKDMGVDIIMSGGQTMNPSTEDFLKAIDKVHAKNVFIFPNNSNIIMAAKQAKDIVTDKNVYVIETKNILQGINSLIYYSEKENIDDMINDFKESISKVKTIETTYAVRNTTIDGIDIKENDYISIGDKGLLSTNANLIESIVDGYSKILTDDDSVVSIYYGENVTEDDASKLKTELEKINGNVEVSIYDGGQPVYYYYISIE